MIAFLNKRITQLSLLLLLFSVSLLIRLPELRSDLNRESEWQTAHILTTLSIWEKDGIATHHFSPVWTFNNPADKFTNSLGGIKDKHNFTYYTSYPPFSFILPYVVFKITGTDVSVNAIRIFSLSVHFLCALLLFFLAKELWNNVLVALTAYCIYIFSGGNLWFHGNFYFADSLVQLFILSSLYVFASLLNSPGSKQNLKSSLLFLLTFLGIYTEWLAFFCTVIILVFLCMRSRGNRIYRPYILWTSLAVIASVSLIIIQYSCIAGFDELKEYSLNKLSSRSGFIESTATDGLSLTNGNSFIEISNNYTRHYKYTGLFFLFSLLAILWHILKKNIRIDFSKTHTLILSVAIFSVVLHHVVFFNFTAVHDISTLKAGIFFSLLLAWTVSIFGDRLGNTVVLGCLFLFIISSAYRYKLVVAPDHDTYFQERVGKIIAEFSSSDEMVFTNAGVSPILMWYSRRNPLNAEHEEECIEKMKALKYYRGVFFKISAKDVSPYYEIIRLNADVKPYVTGTERAVLPDF